MASEAIEKEQKYTAKDFAKMTGLSFQFKDTFASREKLSVMVDVLRAASFPVRLDLVGDGNIKVAIVCKADQMVKLKVCLELAGSALEMMNL